MASKNGGGRSTDDEFPDEPTDEVEEYEDSDELDDDPDDDEADDDEVDEDEDEDEADDDKPAGRSKTSRTSGRAAATSGASRGRAVSRGSKDGTRPGLLGRFVNFVREVVAELQKVIWPTRKELLTYTTVVVVFVAIMMTYVALLDYGFARAMFFVFGRKITT